MANYLFTLTAFVRSNTLKFAEELSEEMADIIPQGFNNNIRWNLGHIYTVQEKFAFQFASEPAMLPELYPTLFSNGTKPADWETQPPTLDELKSALTEQSARIQNTFENRLTEPVAKPFTTSRGLTLSTPQELISYSLYHEGLHLATMRLYKRLLSH